MNLYSRANPEKQVVEVVNPSGEVVLQLSREDCQMLPALIRISAIELWRTNNELGWNSLILTKKVTSVRLFKWSIKKNESN